MPVERKKGLLMKKDDDGKIRINEVRKTAKGIVYVVGVRKTRISKRIREISEKGIREDWKVNLDEVNAIIDPKLNSQNLGKKRK